MPPGGPSSSAAAPGNDSAQRANIQPAAIGAPAADSHGVVDDSDDESDLDGDGEWGIGTAESMRKRITEIHALLKRQQQEATAKVRSVAASVFRLIVGTNDAVCKGCESVLRGAASNRSNMAFHILRGKPERNHVGCRRAQDLLGTTEAGRAWLFEKKRIVYEIVGTGGGAAGGAGTESAAGATGAAAVEGTLVDAVTGVAVERQASKGRIDGHFPKSTTHSVAGLPRLAIANHVLHMVIDGTIVFRGVESEHLRYY